MNLTEVIAGASLTGLEPALICKVVAVTSIADNALQNVATLPDGSPKIRLLSPADEAHNLAAHSSGFKLSKTARFRLGERLGGEIRHLLLMTAPPHSGKEEGFRLFQSLLDSDHFSDTFLDRPQKLETSDLMRRIGREELVTFDGSTRERKGWAEDARASNEIVTGWIGLKKSAGTCGEEQTMMDI